MSISRSAALTAVSAAVLLAGCHRNVRVASAPPPPPPVMVSVPSPAHVFEPEPPVPLAEAPPIEQQLPRVIPPRYRPPAALPSQIAITVPPPAPPPMDLGQLTTGGETGDGTTRREIEDLLRSQQKRLGDLPSATAALHSQQVEQARLFLRQADEAFKKLDVEGARTLATKAKLLLDEILG